MSERSLGWVGHCPLQKHRWELTSLLAQPFVLSPAGLCLLSAFIYLSGGTLLPFLLEIEFTFLSLPRSTLSFSAT